MVNRESAPLQADSPASFRERALRLFPGGSNGEYGLPSEMVPILQRGNGCRVWDTEGREYLDMTMAWGAALVGHAHPKIVETVQREVLRGANFAAINHRALELAERIREISPCAERIRFVASGTEATLLCLRIARIATGRPKLLKFEGAYHGQHPVGVASMIAGRPSNLSIPDATGSGEHQDQIEAGLLVAPFNDLEQTESIVSRHADELAGMIVEPLHRCIAPTPGFLAGLREITRRHGLALIFDEVVTGFRLALGGAQEYYGIVPDLVAYGKALGGGMPIGAVAGRADLMEVVSEHRLSQSDYVWSASTSGGNPVSCAAALAAIDILSQSGVYTMLHTTGRRLRALMKDVLSQAQETAHVLGDGPLAQIAFAPHPIRNQRDWLASDRRRAREVMLQLVRMGVFLNPMGTKLYLSLAHDDSVLEEFAGRLAQAVTATQRFGDASR